MTKIEDRVYIDEDRFATPKHVVDPANGDLYFNEPKYIIRAKGLALLIGTIYQAFVAFGLLAQRLAALSQGDHPLKQVGHIILLPILLIGLCLASIWTIIDPYNGRKLYATLERLMHQDLTVEPEKRVDYLAPCFQPRNIGSASEHYFGGEGQKAF